jgi:hypothetical protein
MQKLITIQPGMNADMSLPYPFHVFEDGRIDRQDFWRGKVFRVIGFQKDFERMTIDLFWHEATADPERAIGMYVVTADDKGFKATWSVHRSAISNVSVTELPERYTVVKGDIATGITGSDETLELAKKWFKQAGGKLSEGYDIYYWLGNREVEVTTKQARAARV